MWIMFDHVNRVACWTTMACHVYDLAYCKMMTIAICDMQSEDTKAQQIMWTKFNETILKHGFPKLNFKGFMAISTQVNWNVIRIVYYSRTLLLGWLIKNAYVQSIGFSCSIGTPKN